MPITVFHLLPDLHVGGILKLIYYNAISLREKNVRNVVIYFNNNIEGRYLFEQAGIELIHVQNEGVLLTLLTAYKLLKAIKSYKADIIHSHLPFDSRFALLVSFFTKAKIVMTLHFVWDKKVFNETVPEKLIKWFFFQCLRRSSRIVAVSEFVRKQYPFSMQEKMELVYSGVVDFSSTLVPEKGYNFGGEPVLLCVGRSHSIKGHIYLLDIIKKLKPVFPGIRMYIYTKNPSHSEYGRDMIAKIDGENLVNEIHFVEDVNDSLLQIALYKAAACFVFPSVYESLPLAILEALSFGLPVIASDVGGIPEVVRDGYNGFLFPVGNTDIAAKKIESILLDDGLRRTLSTLARASFEENFQIAVSADKLLKVYDRVCGKPGTDES